MLIKSKKLLLVGLNTAAVAALMVVATPAFAGHRAGAITISPMVGTTFFDSKANTKDNTKPVLSLGYDFTSHWGIEAIIAQVQSSRKDVANTSVNGALFGLDGVYHFNTDSRLEPYLMAGVGFVRMSPSGAINSTTPKGSENNSDTALNIGGGVEYFTNPWLALRANAGVFQRFDNKQNHYLLSVGLEFVIGGDKNKQPPHPTPGEMPPSPKHGAMPPPPKPQLTREQCIDSKTVVEFAKNSSELEESGDGSLNKVGNCLQAYPKLVAQINGYASDTGTKQHNKILSEQRAQAVADYLVDQGDADANRLSTKGFGIMDPIASNDTAAGRAENRRVATVISLEPKD